jgi:putative colanic acid biosynthesis UDP-glucose lipid carrier transferase
MTAAQTGRYSKYIRPISILLDLAVITVLCLFSSELNLNSFYYILYQTIAWGLIAFFVKFYEIYRFTTPVEIVSKVAKQAIIFIGHHRFFPVF